MKKRRLGLIAVVASMGVAFAQETNVVTPQQFVQENPGPTFRLQGNGELSSVEMLELVFQCLSNGAQVAGDRLVVTGFNMLDPRAYELQGPRALATSLQAAELQAQAAAAEFFQGIVVRARTAFDTTSETRINDAIVGDEVLKNFQMSTVERLSSYTSSEVSAYLRGGRKTGTKVISLGGEGMCVGVRYEVPLDQAGFDPVHDASQAALPPAAPEDGDGTFDAPPPGQVGDW